MGTMTNRNAYRGTLILFLVALGILLGHQPGFSESQDIEKLRKAANQGDAAAQFNLGVRYSRGKGVVPEDDREAVKWFRLAAEQGHATSQHNLAIKYARGQGVPKDQAEAVKWYLRAAEQGHASAQYNLGVMYRYGQGLPQNFINSHAWFNLAAAHGLRDAIKSRDELAARMTVEQLAKAQELASEFYQYIEASISEAPTPDFR